MKRLRSFLDYLEIEKNYSENTLRSYENDLKKFEEFLKKETSERVGLEKGEIDRFLIRKYLACLRDLSLKKKTISRKLSTLRSFFRFLIREGKISDNPALLISAPRREQRLPGYLNISEINELISLPNEKELLGLRDKAILEVLYGSGLRVGELVGLDLNDADILLESLVVLGKGRKERIVPVGSFAQRALREYLERRSRLIKAGRYEDA
ncbi:site-specific integrase, partial [bacterium]|nr:site-specific integrase [bacterium]